MCPTCSTTTASGTSTACHPRWIRREGGRGQDRRRHLRPGARPPLPRAVPRAAGHGHRVLPVPRRASNGPTPGVRRRHAAPGDQPHGRPARGGRHGRDDAPRVATPPDSFRVRSSPAAYGDEVVYERHRHRYEVNPRYRSRSRPRGCVLGGVARRSPGGVHRVARSSVLGRHPGPSRVQEPARPPPSRSSALVGAALDRAEGRDPPPDRHRCRRLTPGGGPTPVSPCRQRSALPAARAGFQGLPHAVDPAGELDASRRRARPSSNWPPAATSAGRSLHRAVQKADIAFQMMIQVRNKMVDAFQSFKICTFSRS